MIPFENTNTARPFPQLPFMSETRFVSFLKDRGLNIGPTGVRAFVDRGIIGKLTDTPSCFHSFQMWPISRILAKIQIDIKASIRYSGLDISATQDFVNVQRIRVKELYGYFEKISMCIEFNERILPFLLWVESYFLPIVRGRVINVDPPSWYRWRRSVNLNGWLSMHSVSIEDIVTWRYRILMDALAHDPSPDSYLLFRSISFLKRDKFKGSLRLAYDLYEIAEILRLFLEQVSEVPVRKEWDPMGDPNTPWVEQFYGSQPQFENVEFLRPLARNYGLDPTTRVLWLVEGITEKAFTIGYVERMGIDINQFAIFHDAGGDGALKDNPTEWIIPRLESAQKEQQFATLTFDDTTDARRQVNKLVEKKLINIPYALNDPDFERENFTVEQLVTIACDWVSESNPISEDIRSIILEQTESRLCEKKEDFIRAFNSVLHQNGITSRISKEPQWGMRLAGYLSDQRENEYQNGDYSEENLSKIEKQILLVYQDGQPFIDYPLSIEHLRPKMLEVVVPKK